MAEQEIREIRKGETGDLGFKTGKAASDETIGLDLFSNSQGATG